MERLPKQVYTTEFQAEAVRLVLEEGLPVTEAARRISVPKGTLTHWVIKVRKGRALTAPSGRTPVSDLEAENARLRRELAETRMERDLLKKAAVNSTDQCNSRCKFICRAAEPQGFSRASIQAKRYSIQVGL